MEDASNNVTNDKVDKGVISPSLTSGEGIEKHLEKQSDNPSLSSEENHEKKQEQVSNDSNQVKVDDSQQNTGFQKRINDLTAKRYQAERERNEMEQRLKALEAQQVKPVEAPVVESVKAPNLPEDLFDEEAMRKYHSDNQKYQAHIAQEAAKTNYEAQQKQIAEKAELEKQQQMVNQYAQNAIRDGVNTDKLHVIEQTLNNAGISHQLGHFIMNDSNGAKIAEYLVDNPSEMYEILKLDPVSAGIQIANQVKPKVLSQTPKVSGAPDPVPEVTGGGYVEKDDFDRTYAGYEIL